MDIDLDFSELYHNRGDYPDKISQKEILSVYTNPKSRILELDGYPKTELFHLICGYGQSKRILLMAGKFENNRIKVLQVKVAEENEIERYYCSR
ncbi:hypothetical protein [Negadavirga shengliensis]|uniref:BrnT family toxin n=1 Tax=Negadavirga shengliensis TaxID=1389218 RepID=A0ABV9T0S5_9BACT